MSEAPVRVIYVAGCGRSGSTLLARMLGQVEGAVSVGELRHLMLTGALSSSHEELCGCGRSYAECPFWLRVVALAFGDQPADREKLLGLRSQVDRVRYVPWMLGLPRPSRYSHALAEYADIQSRLYRAVAEAGGSRLVIDASKDLSTLYLLKHVPGVQVAGVVHLVRDVRGVSYSWTKQMIRPEFVGREVHMRRINPLRTAGYWLYSNLLAELSRHVYPTYLLVRYEDLIQSPRTWIRRVCEVGGLKNPDLGFLGDGVVSLRRTTHIAAGNPSRFRQGEIVLRRDDQWRESLPRLGRLGVSAVGLPLLWRYDYIPAK